MRSVVWMPVCGRVHTGAACNQSWDSSKGWTCQCSDRQRSHRLNQQSRSWRHLGVSSALCDLCSTSGLQLCHGRSVLHTHTLHFQTVKHFSDHSADSAEPPGRSGADGASRFSSIVGVMSLLIPLLYSCSSNHLLASSRQEEQPDSTQTTACRLSSVRLLSNRQKHWTVTES